MADGHGRAPGDDGRPRPPYPRPSRSTRRRYDYGVPSEDDANYDDGFEGSASVGPGIVDYGNQGQDSGYQGPSHEGYGYEGQRAGQWPQGEGQWTAPPGFGPASGYGRAAGLGPGPVTRSGNGPAFPNGNGNGDGFPGNGGDAIEGPSRPSSPPGSYSGYEYSEPFDYAAPERPAPPPSESTDTPVDGRLPQWNGRQGPPTSPVYAETESDDETGPPDAWEEQALRRPGQGRADRRRAAKRIKRRRRLSATKEIPILIGVALLIALVLKTFLVQAFVIPSGSMEQTIKIGDRVLVDKLTPWFGSKPQRGDVVVFEDPGGWLKGEQTKKEDPPPVVKQGKELLTFIGLLPSDDEQDLIKRVVGVGGDTVRCCDKQGRVTVNGTPLKEPYLHPGNKPSQIKFKVTVPVGRVFVMGDHRANSADSRYHLREPDKGMVPERLVQGRAVVIAWPFGHWRRLEEPETYASVPDARGAPASASVAPDNRVEQLPFSAELPLVMGVVGLYRYADRRQSGVRSERGGLGGRRTVRFRRPGGQASRRGRRDGERDGRRRATDRGKRE